MYDKGICYYFITVPPGKSVALFWLHFDVGRAKINNQCQGDSMIVYDGNLFLPLQQWTFCGSKDSTLNITSKSNTVTLQLNSSTSNQFYGFQVKFDSCKYKINYYFNAIIRHFYDKPSHLMLDISYYILHLCW